MGRIFTYGNTAQIGKEAQRDIFCRFLRSKNAEILYVFPIFETVEPVQKIR